MIEKISEDQQYFIFFSLRRLQGLTERLQMAEELTQRNPDAIKMINREIAAFGRTGA